MSKDGDLALFRRSNDQNNVRSEAWAWRGWSSRDKYCIQTFKAAHDPRIYKYYFSSAIVGIIPCRQDQPRSDERVNRNTVRWQMQGYRNWMYISMCLRQSILSCEIKQGERRTSRSSHTQVENLLYARAYAISHLFLTVGSENTIEGSEIIWMKGLQNDRLYNPIPHNSPRTSMLTAASRPSALTVGYKFLFDGEVIQKGKSPKELDMADGDVIDAMVGQIGDW